MTWLGKANNLRLSLGDTKDRGLLAQESRENPRGKARFPLRDYSPAFPGCFASGMAAFSRRARSTMASSLAVLQATAGSCLLIMTSTVRRRGVQGIQSPGRDEALTSAYGGYYVRAEINRKGAISPSRGVATFEVAEGAKPRWLSLRQTPICNSRVNLCFSSPSLFPQKMRNQIFFCDLGGISRKRENNKNVCLYAFFRVSCVEYREARPKETFIGRGSL